MLRQLNSIISLPTYKQYWIHTKPYGHDIVIWADTGRVTIQCRWSDMERSNNNRVKKISEKSFLKKIMKCKEVM